MSFLNSLPATTEKSKKRLGRGLGSGKGFHTVGRGQKGQKARTKIHPAFMGTKVKKSLLQRLPLMRGKGTFKSLKSQTVTVSLSVLDTMPANSLVTAESLYVAGKISQDPKNPKVRVKIVANGKLNTPLTVSVPSSEKAAALIIAAGGSVQ